MATTFCVQSCSELYRQVEGEGLSCRQADEVVATASGLADSPVRSRAASLGEARTNRCHTLRRRSGLELIDDHSGRPKFCVITAHWMRVPARAVRSRPLLRWPRHRLRHRPQSVRPSRLWSIGAVTLSGAVRYCGTKAGLHHKRRSISFNRRCSGMDS
jgi:hypothetical protein